MYVLCPLLELGMAQRKFAQCLGEFQFEYIGDAKTDDEKCIGKFFLYSFLPAKQYFVWFPPTQNTFNNVGFVYVCLILSLLCTIDNLFYNDIQFFVVCCLFLDDSLLEFSSFLKNLEDQRELMVSIACKNMPEPGGISKAGIWLYTLFGVFFMTGSVHPTCMLVLVCVCVISWHSSFISMEVFQSHGFVPVTQCYSAIEPVTLIHSVTWFLTYLAVKPCITLNCMEMPTQVHTS